jgi:GntR family transcriptional regulator
VSVRRGQPFYTQVADALRADIRAGTYGPGAQLPSERELRERFSVSSNTIRAAIVALRTEGLVVSYQGRGVFVREQKARRRTTADMVEPGPARGWYSVVAHAGERPASRTTVTQGPCPPEVAEQLGIEAGTEVMIRDRVMRVEGQAPDQLATSYYTLAVAEQVPQLRDPTKGGQLNALEAAFGPIWHNDVITARMPDERERELLELVPGVPVVVVNGTTFDQQNQVLTHIVKAVVSDRLELSYRYGAVPSDEA